MYGSTKEGLLGPRQNKPKARWTRLTVTLLVGLGIFLAIVAFQQNDNGMEAGVGRLEVVENKSHDDLAFENDVSGAGDDKKDNKGWYEKDDWGTQPECQDDGKKGEPTLKTKGRYEDEGWVCGKENVAVACDNKAGMDIETTFVVVQDVKQHVFTGGMRLDDAKQLNSVTRSMRITRKCNADDLLKNKKNRCDLKENDFAQGEDNTQASKKRRYLIHYVCRYGKRKKRGGGYKAVIAPAPAVSEAADETTEKANETTESAKQDTTEPAKQDTTEPAKQDTEEKVQTSQQAQETTETAKQTTEEAKAQDTTEPPKQDTTEPPKQDTTEPPKQDTTEPPKQDTTEASAQQTTQEAADTTKSD